MFGITAQLIWTHAAEQATELELKNTQVNHIPSKRLSRCDAHCVEVWLRAETAGIILQPPLFNPDPVLLYTIYHTEYDSFPR